MCLSAPPVTPARRKTFPLTAPLREVPQRWPAGPIIACMPSSLTEPIIGWYAKHARDLPWRAHGVTPWSVLVSEIMLQQTPVSRVLPAHAAWLERWPAPKALAAEPAGEAVRQWGRLGYPRRALRLHTSACIVTSQYAGNIPEDHDQLLKLPGIGAYTAAAVAVFAFG